MAASQQIFQLFRYQLLPIDRFLQTSLLTDVRSIEELLQRKNEFFAEALSGRKDFSVGKYQSVSKELYNDGDFFLFKVGVNRSVHIETVDFDDKIVENWPSILVAVWNHPKRQLFAVQKRSVAFQKSEGAVKMILKAISPQLEVHHLRPIHEPLFEKQVFWDLLASYAGKIQSADFDLVTPNMANISGALSEELKNFSKATNSVKNKLRLESDSESALELDADNETLRSLVDYSSEGGGNISLKIRGSQRKVSTSDTVKETYVDLIEIEGHEEQIVGILKEVLSIDSDS